MDARFARLRTDPRFRRPRKEKSKVVVDQRFNAVFEPNSIKGRVDKYGRPVSATQEHENLRRFYRLEKADDNDTAFPDYARGEALLESSDDDESDIGSSDAGSQHADPINLTANAEIDLDESSFADLDAQAAEYSNTHPDEEHAETAQTNRLAAVNLDWDHVRAVHLFKICSSLVSPTAAPLSLKKKTETSKDASRVVRGKVLSVRVYPSQFGKERLSREEKEGPPAEIFKKKTLEDEINEKNIYDTGDGDDYDEDALRKYQLERLRYFYAVITCDSVDAAAHVYSELEGTELERSANIFDLSFVPHGMTFDQDFRDEATENASTEYRGVNFVTDALRHSKVKLTWDDDDPERNRITRRALTRKEIEENDFKNLIASSSEDESDAEPQLSRDKLRSLLLDGAGDDLPEGWDRADEERRDVDMEITFTPGLSELKSTGDETTLEKYQRKLKEKRKKKKPEPSVAKEDAQDEFFDDEPEQQPQTGKKPTDKPARTVSTAEELSLLVSADDPTAEHGHFDMKAIVKAEKAAKSKRKRKTAEIETNEMQQDFAINVQDSRFARVHEDHAFAIDPSNPHFKKTKGMTALLEERAKRQKQSRHGTERKKSVDGSGRSLESLVESVKRKSGSSVQQNGKRRKT